VRWSRAQYEAYLKKTGTVPAPAPIRKRKKSPLPRGKTKAEMDFELWFFHEHPSLTLLYEALKLQIDRSCWYLPDFFCPELSTFYEVKGPWIAEDSIIKFKAARAIHTWARFMMFQKHLEVWRQIRRLPDEPLE
jgi:hypothetical protein